MAGDTLGALVGRYNHTRFVDLLSQGLSKVDPSLKRSLIGAIRSRNAEKLGVALARLDDPALHGDPETYFHAAQLAAAVKKYPLDMGIDTAAEARKSFYAAELQCRQTNNRFRNLYKVGCERSVEGAKARHTLVIAEKAASLIRNVLGSVSHEEIYERARHSNGATMGVKGAMTEEAIKFLKAQYGNRFTAKWYNSWLNEQPFIANDTEYQVQYNTLATVPKTWKTDRNIAVEPCKSMPYQLGIGEAMRERLLRFCGIDLKYGQRKNAALARKGSVDGSLSTLDLSAASDTISSEVVRRLFCKSKGWLTHLELARSPFYKAPDGEEVILYEKFSSMGNGFTFPLETLIFYAIVRTTIELYASRTGSDSFDPALVAVYGDDIVVPTKYVRMAMMSLNLFGFKLNREKSFWNGPFRESCGEDYWYGTRVRPMFFKQELRSKSDVIGAINSLIRIKNEWPSVDVGPAMAYLAKLLGEHDYFGPCQLNTRQWIWTHPYHLRAYGHLRKENSKPSPKSRKAVHHMPVHSGLYEAPKRVKVPYDQVLLRSIMADIAIRDVCGSNPWAALTGPLKDLPSRKCSGVVPRLLGVVGKPEPTSRGQVQHAPELSMKERMTVTRRSVSLWITKETHSLIFDYYDCLDKAAEVRDVPVMA